MILRKGFKFRLNVTAEQESRLWQTAGCCRFVWNKILATQKERLDKGEKRLSKTETINLLPKWKREQGTEFLKEPPSQTLQQKLMDLDKAFKDAFDKAQPNKKFPTFKKRLRRNSFRFPQHFKVEGNRVKLPDIGWFSFRKSREIIGEIANITVSRGADGKWFVSFQTELEIKELPVHKSTTAVGIDVGITRFATLSDGTFYLPLNSFKKLENKLARAQRSLARKVKFSENWKKQKRKIARLHAKIANARIDYLHKASTEISKNHAMIALEDLKITEMSASAKGTMEKPGKNVKRKTALNKAILDQGWGYFRRFIQYKQDWNGGICVLVPPEYTSQTCPACNHIHPKNRTSQAAFRCLACGFSENADRVGAINILAAGHAVIACGEAA